MSEKLHPMSAEELKELVGDRKWLPLRRCGICDEVIGYAVLIGGEVVFDGSCGCTRLPGSPRPSSWQEIVDNVNRQETLAARTQILDTLLRKRPPQ